MGKPERLDHLVQVLCRPGAREAVTGVAPTQRLDCTKGDAAKPEVHGSIDNITGYTVKAKQRLLDRCLDQVVRASGSDVVFFATLTGLLVWAFLAIPLHHSIKWQIIISDIQAILSYAFDSLLMRQQLNSYRNAILAAAELRSRTVSHARMLSALTAGLEEEELDRLVALSKHRGVSEFRAELPFENWFGRAVTCFSNILGHIITIILYWVSIAVWIAFGPANRWSNEWQLDVNSATSALMVFVFISLAHIRERHGEYANKCMEATFKVDSALELKFRRLTGDTISNEPVTISAPKVNVVQRIIDYYADLVGTLVGIAILFVVIIVWIAIGPVLSFNSNWWLIIGTYAGLIGLNDGFVLRNVQAHLKDHETAEYAKIDADDEAVCRMIKLPAPGKESDVGRSLSSRVSAAMSRVCAHESTVVLGFLVVVGLVCGSSAMHWSTTGQLLSNVPPSIIESFFMIILITGHNFAEATRRAGLETIYERRLNLMAFVDVLAESRQQIPTSEVKASATS
jgi:low-affinity ferrous iron transport protein